MASSMLSGAAPNFSCGASSNADTRVSPDRPAKTIAIVKFSASVEGGQERCVVKLSLDNA